jgi:catechol 2,3-dioxygenase-like lactoylglutathione lyase family enzyme
VAIYNHTGQVVSDLERAKRFYLEVFGFKFWYEITPPDGPTAKLSGHTPPGNHGLISDPRRVCARTHALRREWRDCAIPVSHNERAWSHPPVDLSGRRSGHG